MSKSVKWYVNSIIAIAIMFFVRFIPAPEPMTQLGMTVLGIFIGAIYGWCTTDLIWPALIALVMLGFTDFTTVTAAWGMVMSNGTVGMCLWLMIAIGILSTSDLTHWIAKWSVSRPWSKGRPWVLVNVVLLADMVCSAIIGGIATIVLFLGLAVSICEEVGYHKGDKMPAFFCFAVGFYSTIATLVFPFHTAIIANFGFLAAGSNGAYDGTFSYSAYMIFSFTVITAVYIMTLLFLKYVAQVDTSLMKNYDPGKNEVPPMNKQQKLSLLLFGILFVLFMGPSFFPKGSLPFEFCNKLGVAGACILMVGIACLLRVDGKPFTTFQKLVSENVMWPVVLMYGTAVILASGLNKPELGVSLYIKGLLTPVFSGMSSWAFLITFMGIALIFTNLVNNTVVSAIMVPLSYGFCMDLGLNPVAFVACFVLFVDYAILLPSSSPCGALMHANDGWLPKKYLYIYGSIALILTFIISLGIGWPIASRVL